MIKIMTFAVHFPDDFAPPDKFDEATEGNDWASECKPCPFFGWEDETGFNWCDCPDTNHEDECPIKRYFDNEGRSQ